MPPLQIGTQYMGSSAQFPAKKRPGKLTPKDILGESSKKSNLATANSYDLAGGVRCFLECALRSHFCRRDSSSG